MAAWSSTLLLLVALAEVKAIGDGYGTGGIAKYTLSASHPISFYAFLQRYFPVHCQDEHTVCNTSFTCGQSGRASLCLDDACTYPTSGNHVFGLHLVNVSSRPYGPMDNIDVERHFTEKLQRSFKTGRYDSFMDASVVLYAANLDRYIQALQKDAVQFLLLKWKDETGAVWHSLIVQISTSQLVLELVSPKAPAAATFVLQDLQRLPSVVFSRNNVSSALPSILVPLAVSKAVSNMSQVADFYEKEMFGEVTHRSSSESTHIRSFTLEHSSLLVRLVERPAAATIGSFKVHDLEEAKIKAHKMSKMDDFCGVSKWYDNHFAYDAFWNTSLDAFKAAFDRNERIYHIFGDCKPVKLGPGTNMYVVDPTGDAVQVDGHWKQCPHGGTGDALQNPCSQGSCSKFKASTQCNGKLNDLCGAVKLKNNTCTDCGYNNWKSLTNAGCRNADVVNYCIPTSDPQIGVII